MNDTPPHFALRQIREDFGRPVTWIILVGIGIVLALAGAFGTGDVLRPLPLTAYWIVVVILTYGAGAAVNGMLRRRLDRLGLVPRVGLLGLTTGGAVAILIVALNTALFGPILSGPGEWSVFLGTVFAVTLVVSLVLELAMGASGRPDRPGNAPVLLDRLPAEKRGPLVALSVEDHYVRVRTTRGEEMLLMRLTDAMREAGPGGLQVHRSHWVARDRVVAARRDGDRAILTLTAGGEIPVSRRYVPAIREAGLLQGKPDG